MTAAGGLALLLLLGGAPAPAQNPTPAATTTGSPAAAAPRAPADPWAPMRPLLGDWVGEPSGRPGEPIASTFSFVLALDGGIMVRRHRAALAPRPGETAGSVHEDLLVVWPEGDGFRATYWDNERHLIRYTVRFAGGAIVFDSEPGPGPRFRLEYRPRPDGGQDITFSFGPPGGELKPYASGGAHRKAD